MNDELLKRLSDADSIASCEDEVRNILYHELKDYCDEVYCDSLGSVIFHKKGCSLNPLKIMFCAHMDEVGFYVGNILSNGMIKPIPVGGFNYNSLQAQRVILLNKWKVKFL